MKILVLSDTHGELSLTKKVIDKENADVVLHIGDVGFEPQYLGQVYYVKGNHDTELQEPKERLLTFLNHTIYMTHGDLYENEVMANLKQKYDQYWIDMETCMQGFEEVMLDVGRRKQADIVCFGHTHQPLLKEINGRWFLNPGSLAYPFDGKQVSYALIHLDEDMIRIELKYHPWDEK